MNSAAALCTAGAPPAQEPGWTAMGGPGRGGESRSRRGARESRAGCLGGRFGGATGGGVSVDWGHHSPGERGQELGADPGTPTRSQHLTFRVSLGVPRERGHSRR